MLLPSIPRRLVSVRPMVHSFRILPHTVHGSTIGRQHHDQSNPVSHGVESYFVDGDDSPPPADSIYKVDASSDAAESAHEPPSGPWSRAGAETAEYRNRTVSNDEPYEVPSGTDKMLRYMEDKNLVTGNAGEGPKGTERWGRKSEGRA